MKQIILLGLALLGGLGARAQQWDDKIVIADCEDQYILQMDGGHPVVKNKTSVTYESLSAVGVTAQTVALYGDNIELGRVSTPGTKTYKNVTPENVFYDDSKGCFITCPIRKKGKTGEVSWSRTFTDIKYFTRVYLLDDYFIRHKTVTVTIPRALSGYRIKEMNFAGYPIAASHTSTADAEVYTYTIDHASRMKDEENTPPASNVFPYLMVLGSFPSVDDFYTWSAQMSAVDTAVPGLEALVKEITAGCKTDEERLSNTYHWVQDHIRYVAFEAGMSGFRPDTPAEVLRKRYGDCKGMALLLKTLLRAEGFDARLTDIGTDEVPCTMTEAPTLAATNHAICTVRHKGRDYYLDATCKYVPYTYVPQHIQGSQAMIEDGPKPLLQTVPVRPADSSLDSLCYQYRLQGDALVGKATYQLRGDMKEWFMTSAEKAGNKDNDEMLGANLNADNHSMAVSGVKWIARDPREEWARFEGDVSNTAAVQRVDGEVYVELNPHNNLFDSRIDTTDRVGDYYLPVRCNIVRQAVLTLPAGFRVAELPRPATFTLPGGVLSCTFSRQGGRIVYHQKMQINRRRIPRAEIPAWNTAISRWQDACNRQLVLRH